MLRYRTMILLLLVSIVSASSGVITDILPVGLFRVRGDSAHLTVPGYEQLKFFWISWTFGFSNIVEYTKDSERVLLYPKYKNKVQFNKKDFSLFINYLEEGDNGLFKAVVIDILGTDTTVAEYIVYVREKVSPPALLVNSESPKSEFCSFLVTCSTDGAESSTYSCRQSHCTEITANYSRSPALLIDVSTDGKSVVCNVSNQVSWSISSVAVSDSCPFTASDTFTGFPLCLMKIIVLSVGLVFMVAAVIGVHVWVSIRSS